MVEETVKLKEISDVAEQIILFFFKLQLCDLDCPSVSETTKQKVPAAFYCLV